jgi:DNA-directed RNA polymerase specialized sigma24 family protein
MDYWRKKYAKRVIRVVGGQWAADSGQWTVEQRQNVSRKMNKAVEMAYQQLKPIQVKLLRWKYEENKSVKEIAGLLGWSLKAVEAQLYRSRKAFQKVYVPVEEYF